MNFKTRNKLTIGLTGSILCGKSTALAAWRRAGAFVLSCDEIARELLAQPAVKRRIAVLFGTIDKAEITRQVFSNLHKRTQLEKLLHPLVAREIKKRLQHVPQPVRVIEVPLLFEAQWGEAFDLTVCIVASQRVRTARLKKRAMSQTDFKKRDQAQFSQTEKAALSDICIINMGTSSSLTEKINTLHQALCQIYTNK